VWGRNTMGWGGIRGILFTNAKSHRKREREEDSEAGGDRTLAASLREGWETRKGTVTEPNSKRG